MDPAAEQAPQSPWAPAKRALLRRLPLRARAWMLGRRLARWAPPKNEDSDWAQTGASSAELLAASEWGALLNKARFGGSWAGGEDFHQALWRVGFGEKWRGFSPVGVTADLPLRAQVIHTALSEGFSPLAAKGWDDWAGVLTSAPPALAESLLADATERQWRRWRAGNGLNALMAAARQGKPELAKRLLPFFNPNEQDPAGMAALHHAALAGSSRVVELLLADGADAKAADRAGRTPLALAAGAGNLGALRRLLPASDASLAGRDGKNALMLAAEGGHVGCAALLAAVSPLGATDKEGRSAEHLARMGSEKGLSAKNGQERVFPPDAEREKEPRHEQTLALLVSKLLDQEMSALRAASRAAVASAARERLPGPKPANFGAGKPGGSPAAESGQSESPRADASTLEGGAAQDPPPAARRPKRL